MASFRALCLAGVASLAVTAAADAADLLPPPPPVEAPLYAPAPPIGLGGGWYLRGDVGVGAANLKQDSSSFNPANVPPGIRYNQDSLDDSAIIDVGAGFRFNEYFRADVTGEYRSAAHFSAVESYNQGFFSKPKTGIYSYDNYSGQFQTIDALVNGYVDLGTWYGVTPFVGAGIGVARIGVNNIIDSGSGEGLGGDHSQTNFAYALMAGLDFAVTQNLKLELGYRYLNLGKVASGTIVCQNEGSASCPNEVQHFRLASNDIRLGFRYMFADFAPLPEPQIPLIRKY